MERMEQKKDALRPAFCMEIAYYQDSKWYKFVPSDNQYMILAKNAALQHSLTSVFPIGIVAVKNGNILATAGNGNGYHEKNINSEGHIKGCVRRFVSNEQEKTGGQKLLSGEGFELCTGCSVDSHAESNLLKSVPTKSVLEDADVYMYGHFWCCEDCWKKLLDAKIQNVYIVEDVDFKDKDVVRKWSEEFNQSKDKKDEN